MGQSDRPERTGNPTTVARKSDRELTVTAQVLSFVDPVRNTYRFRL